MSSGSDDTASATPAPRPSPKPAAPKSPPKPLFAPAASLVGIVVLLAAWFLTGGGRNAPLAKAASEAAAAPPATAATPETPPPPAFVTQDDLKALTKQLDELKTGLGELKSQVDNLPKPAPAPDLKPIETKLDELAKLPEQLTALSGRLDGTEKTLDDLKGKVEKLQTEPKPAPAAATPSETEKPKLAGEDLTRAANLIKQRQFPQAAADLGKLREQFPQDARVWYLSALASGFKSGDWKGEAIDFANRAVELEKAGSPDHAAIGAALTGLDADATRWIAYFRQKAK